VFGNSLDNTQQFTGSVSVTGSLTVVTAGTELQVTSTGVNLGNISTDNHNITGSLRVSGSIALNGALTGTNATFRVSADRNLATRFDTNIVLSAQSDTAAPESLRIYADTFRLFTATTAGGLTERLTISNTGVATFSTNSNSTIVNTFQNTNTTNTNSRNMLNVTAGNVTLQLTAIHGDNVYISPSTAVSTYIGYNNTVQIASTGAANFSNSLRIQGSTVPASGAGTELAWDGTNGYLLAYNRTTSAYLPLSILGSSLSFTGAATFSSTVTLTTSSQPIINLNTTSANQASAIVTTESGTSKWAFGTNLGAGDNSFNIYNYAAAARYLTITSGGNVGIGTTTINSERLTVVQTTGNASALYVYTSGVTTGQSYGLTVVAGTNSSDRSFAVFNQAGNTEYLKVRGDGFLFSSPTYNNTFGSSANMYVNTDGSFGRATSSLKYKTDVKNYDKGLAEVLKMRPVYYKSINEREKDLQFAGLIAEEVHELGLTEFVQYAPDGSPDALSYQNMIALAFKAIQELKSENDNLKSRLEVLEQS
jgi:hypothetical protein